MCWRRTCIDFAAELHAFGVDPRRRGCCKNEVGEMEADESGEGSEKRAMASVCEAGGSVQATFLKTRPFRVMANVRRVIRSALTQA